MDRGRTAGRPSASRRHVDHSASMMLRGPRVAGATRPASEQAGRHDDASRTRSPGRVRRRGGHDGPVDAGNPSAEQRLGTAAIARRRGRLRRVAAGEPGLVGRRRRRLPRRARRRHRRRRLRLVPGGPARSRRPSAGRRRRTPRPGGRLRIGAVRTLARDRRAPGRSGLDLSARDAATRRRRSTPRRVSLFRSCRPGPSGCPSPTASFDLACSAFGAVPFVAEPERVMREVARVLRPGGRWVFAVNHPMRWMFSDDPGPDGLTVDPVVLRPDALRRGGRGGACRPTSSTTARWATGSATSSPPGWCSTTWWSPSGRRAARRCGGSGRRCAARCSPAPRSSSATARDHAAGGFPAALTGRDAPPRALHLRIRPRTVCHDTGRCRHPVGWTPGGEEGRHPVTSRPPGNPPPPTRTAGMTWGDVVQFLVALLGVLLVGITPNPPVTFRDWLQILVGAALTAAMATAAVRDWVRRSASQALSSGPAGRLRDWRLWAWVLATGLLAAVVAVAVPFLFDVARGLSYRVLGCPPAVQLRVLAEPETVATARELAIRYERWTADGNHGCPTAQAYVFAAEPATIVQKVATTDGWSDATQSLRAVGPRSDVWLASTRREVDAATTAGGAIAESLPVAHSPLVLAVPAGALRPTGPWPQVLRQLEEAGDAVVRPDPRTTQVGRLAAVLLYGRDTAYPDAARSLAVERSLDAARGTLPIGGAAELLCPRRDRRAPAPRPPPRRRHRAGRRTLQPGRGARRDVRSDPGPPGAGPADRGRLPGRHRRPGPAARPAALDRSGNGSGAGLGGARALAARRRRPPCRRGDRAATHRDPPAARRAAHRRLRRHPHPRHVPGTGLRRAVDGRLRRARGGPATQPAARPRRHVQLDGQGGTGRHRGATGPHPCRRGGRRRGRRAGGPAAG